eukprot:Blabericola_migrator_1__8284@NODE_429_length_8570_cov_338_451135_g338_i0_p4_GENE_NODE_429_length_8570_cov_338_451135_g338_i0NODE_429_length_8570_cov_338_451135_g338_i0_p4_ORF_typecomplete_len337_score41_86WD40/PF00400_32/4_8WD40/PF00400_32/6_8e05WD40/PF00400_32/9_7WD40/PF00400_32/2_9e05WD40/PF00400_32/1_3e02WD40/PF00400_32/33ANAPC4_WD40/PF12894_7/0_6ANAPC4_WD40/PF12894_7/3_8ANAPC4_WD40/PF12894_7/0_0096ANAPC4_WD40/PF12894_7/3_9e07ANAPC4_WD40/PF12894_7/11Ge1_WD40/PF16529_5/0_31Ge1_WD40/PF16529_5/0
MLNQVHPVTVRNSRCFLDVKYDPSGQQLATTSIEGAVYMWPTAIPEGEQQVPTHQQPTSVLKEHDGPVWTIAFAPASYGNVCVTGGFDRKVIIWKDFSRTPGVKDWQSVFCDESRRSGVACVACCSNPGSPLSQFQTVAMPPNAYMGLHVAAASMDGTVTICSLTTGGGWVTQSFIAHLGGVKSVSWSTSESVTPPTEQMDDMNLMAPIRRLATAGVDGMIKVWQLNRTQGEWVVRSSIPVGTPIRAVAWHPANESPRDLLAVLCENGTIAIYEAQQPDAWLETSRLLGVGRQGTKVSWSPDGLLLSVPPPSDAPPSNVVLIRENTETRAWEVCVN